MAPSLLPCPRWHLHVARGGDGDEPAALQAPRHLRSPSQGPFLSPVPQFPPPHAPSSLADSDVLAACWFCGGARGGPGEGSMPVAVFYPCPCQKTSSFFSLGMHCGGRLSPVPPGRGSFILWIHQGLACPISNLNLLEIPKDGGLGGGSYSSSSAAPAQGGTRLAGGWPQMGDPPAPLPAPLPIL